MRIQRRGERITFDDTPRGTWVLGAIAIVGGTFVLALPLLVNDWSTWTLAEKLAIPLLIGVPQLGGGLLAIRMSPATRTVIDRAGGEGVHVVRRAGSAPVTTRFRLAEATGVDLVRSRDDEGTALCQLRLWLSGSRALLLEARASAGEARSEEEARLLREAVGLA